MNSPDSSKRARSIRLAYGSEAQQFGELYLPTNADVRPVVILIHGGFWRAAYDLSLMTELAQDLVKRGFAVWNIEYRRVGEVGGGWPGTLQDVAQATDHLTKLASSYPLDVQRVVGVGHSAGGHLALWLAGRTRIAKESALAHGDTPQPLIGAISLAGVADLELAWRLHLSRDAVVELLGGTPEEVPERYALASPVALSPLGTPQVLIHGTDDNNVPLEISQSYLAKANAAGDTVTLIELAGADHFVLIDANSTVWPIIVDEITKLVS